MMKKKFLQKLKDETAFISNAGGTEKLPSFGSSPNSLVTEEEMKENLSVLSNKNSISIPDSDQTQRSGNSLPCPNLIHSPKSRCGIKIKEPLPLSPILPVDSPGHQKYVSDNANFDHDLRGTVPGSAHLDLSPVVHHAASGNDDIRHHLLVQRTFNIHEDEIECSPIPGQPRAQLSPFLTPYNDNASDFHSVFQTPVRGRHYRHEHALESTPSSYPQHSLTPSQYHHSVTPLRYQHCITPRRLQGTRTPSSTAGSPYLFTPGRNFFNPFEIDTGQLHLPVVSPGLFQIGDIAQTQEDAENKEPFWSVEHAAMLMPVDIKESDVLKQHLHQQKRDNEKDDAVQAAIDKFFSNKYILRSPWSEKASQNLTRTACFSKSVSSQTSMSVPPNVDLFSELKDKYQLPEHMLEPEISPDSMGSSFIRRKLLHQLNENDSPTRDCGVSPNFPSMSVASPPESTFVTSPTKQVTPEMDDRRTPRKKGSGHFSSSPIREAVKEYQPMSESELLASPELSPIAGRGRKSIRTSDIFYSDQDVGGPREIMQLDFSSILDEPDEFESVSDKTRTVINPKVTSLQHSENISNSSSAMQEENAILNSSSRINNEDGSASSSKLIFMMGRASANSGLSTESVIETNSTAAVPHSISSQDTGYQTASIQSTINQESGFGSIHLSSQETLLSSGHVSSCNINITDPARTLTERDLLNNVGHTSLTNQFTGMPFRSDTLPSQEDTWFGLTSGSHKEGVCLLSQTQPALQRHEICRIRKVKTLSDMRRSKEKRSASRNLTHSFNEEDRLSNFGGSNERLNESSSCSLFNSKESSEAKFFTARVKSEPFGTQISAAIMKEKVPDCVLKETLIQNSQMASAEHYLPTTILPSDKRSFKDIGSNCEVVRHVNEGKFIKLGITDAVGGVSNSSTGSNQRITHSFSLRHESTLADARTLLGQSEALRMQLENSSELESDTFYQLINEAAGQNEHAKDDTASVSNPLSSADEPSVSLSQSSLLMDSLKNKIYSVEGDKLASEIAAEILKRAGDDLAQIEDLM